MHLSGAEITAWLTLGAGYAIWTLAAGVELAASRIVTLVNRRNRT